MSMPLKIEHVPIGCPPTIAQRLLEAICSQDHPVGHRLTEQSLADELGVSRSPVRRALKYLEAVGAVKSSKNRGFFVARNGKELRGLELPAVSESEESLYMRIVEGRLTGALPEVVAEAQLMEMHGLTRLQVQRVLNRMCREGMIDRKPGRGWAFRPVLSTVESHRESYRFRMIIEPAAILESTFKVNSRAFDRVRARQQRLLDGGLETWTPAERFRAGREFHETIVACSGNRFLIDALKHVNQLRRVIEYHSHTNSILDRERLRRQCEEHLYLLLASHPRARHDPRMQAVNGRTSFEVMGEAQTHRVRVSLADLVRGQRPIHRASSDSALVWIDATVAMAVEVRDVGHPPHPATEHDDLRWEDGLLEDASIAADHCAKRISRIEQAAVEALFGRDRTADDRKMARLGDDRERARVQYLVVAEGTCALSNLSAVDERTGLDGMPELGADEHDQQQGDGNVGGFHAGALPLVEAIQKLAMQATICQSRIRRQPLGGGVRGGPW